ncbi:MAG: enoyl-CoA hydratase [Pseudomonadota bacterium]|jgi:enoyl-CoA hydratase/carnithine racemase|nr:enoyl-CoA hydratase/isomerase family protein [Rubrivivax sp.]NLZ42913.1 enoyl-CoA hydratase/isomerase family protein [Comamonadaceae bacterium]
MSDMLLLEHDGGVTTLTLNRPPLNLMTPELLERLVAALEALAQRDETRAIVIRGAGTRAFCAGADLKSGAEENPASASALRDVGMRMIELIEEHPKPVVTAVRGWCIGGGTAIAWPADIRLAAASAKFRAGDVYLGMAPTWGLGNARLVHYLGRNRTLDIALLGDDISAQEAYDWGLVTRVFPDEVFDREVARIAHKLAGAAPLPVRAIKQTVRAQYRDSPDRAQLLTERWHAAIHASHDLHEGIQAMIEKRKPVFKGR